MNGGGVQKSVVRSNRNFFAGIRGIKKKPTVRSRQKD